MANILHVAIAVSTLVVLVQAGPIPVEFKEVAPGIRETCMAESGASLELIEKAAKGDFVEDDQLKCYLKCIFDQFRLLSKKGFNWEAMMSLSPPNLKQKAKQIIKDCSNTEGKGDDMCDLSFNINKCMFATAPDEYFVI